jgi:hypothetical protein
VLLILLPILGFIISYLVVAYLLQQKNLWGGWIQVLLFASVGGQTWLVLSTELLSFFKVLNIYGLVVTWSGYILLLSGIAYFFGLKPHKLQWPHLPPLSLFLTFTVDCIVLIIATTGWGAFISPPNNMDSMIYHMSRVAHWLQNQSVAYYPACISRQNHLSPGAEFTILHWQILSGGDHFANLVQWLSMVGCIVGSSFVARLLGANREGQIFTAVAAATLPMGVLQAVTTQNDYAVAFWLICFISFILQIKTQWSWIFLLGAAASLALALLTKATAFLFAFPFVIWLGWELIKLKGWQMWRPVLVITIIVLIINSGYFYRNLQLFGSPLGPATEGPGFEYANQTFTLTTTISNLVRNVVLHLYLPDSIMRDYIQFEVRQLHNWLGISPADPRTTWGGAVFHVPVFGANENVTGNFVHFLLIIFSSVLILAEQLRRRGQGLTLYICLLITAFGLFVFYLKWQPWHSRLHLPLFVLWSPVVGIWLSRLRLLPIQSALVVILILQALPFIFFNPYHPVIGPKNVFNMSRLEQYFLSDPPLLTPYLQMAQVIHENQCYQVGLTAAPPELREYFLWVALQAESDHLTQLHCLDVENASASLATPNLPLCAVICLDCPGSRQERYQRELGPPALNSGGNMLFIRPASSLVE